MKISRLATHVSTFALVVCLGLGCSNDPLESTDPGSFDPGGKADGTEFSLSAKALFSWTGKTLSKAEHKSYGTKGVNFRVLDNALSEAGVDRSLFKGGFLIPFSRYDDHMRQVLTSALCEAARKKREKTWSNGSCEGPNAQCVALAGGSYKIADFLAQTTSAETLSRLLADASFRKGWLEYCRELIEQAELDPSFLSLVTDKITASYAPTVRILLRSSTTSEDLPGLNGAGFYESKAGCVADGNGKGAGASACMTAEEIQRTKDLIAELQQKDAVAYKDLIADLTEDLTKKRPIDKAIKKVLASLWTDRAFLFRDYYRIKHEKVFMGILVHPSFVDEGANGVAFSGPGASGEASLCSPDRV